MNHFYMFEGFHFVHETILAERAVRFFGFGIDFDELTDLVIVQVLKADWT
jgi:hypothetical protein